MWTTRVLSDEMIMKQIHQTSDLRAGAHRQRERDGLDLQFCDQGINHLREIRTVLVEVIHKNNTRKSRIVDGRPEPLDVTAHPHGGTHNQDDAIRHAQGRSRLADKAGRTWGIEKVEPRVFVGTVKDAGVERHPVM